MTDPITPERVTLTEGERTGPTCVCGENFSDHPSNHTFVAAEHYGTGGSDA